ncbi:MAG: 6-bladed beta-propeller [Bacteroidales bacterium]|nr:6-bladed beta-propeller [Bacteroidales bacterium]
MSLETTGENLISSVDYLEVSKNKIYVTSRSNCYVFSRGGNFLRKVYNKGRGPGELQSPRGLTILGTTGKFSVYDNRSKFIAEFSDSFEMEKRIYPGLNYVSDLYWINNGKYLLYSYLPQPNSEKDTLCNYCIYEFDPDTKKARGILKMPNNYESLNIEYHTTFSKFKLRYFVRLTLNNNVFEYNDSGLMLPRYAVDFGKYNAPEELLNGKLINVRILFGRIKEGKFCVLVDFQELEGHYIVIYDKYPDRYTTIISKGNGSQVRHSFRNEDDVLSRATPFFEHDGYMIASLQPSSFLKKYKVIAKSTLSDYEKNIYAEIADGLNESDNPVLLFLKPR